MSSGHIVEIKLRPYLKDFFINKFGGSEPIKATILNKLYPFLVQYLTPKTKNWKPPLPSRASLLIELPYNDELNIRCYNYIHPRHYPSIMSYFYGIFYAQFISYMNEKVMKERWQVKFAIINFIDTNNISWEHVNYDSLKRIYYRYRFHDSDREVETKDSLLAFKTSSEKIRNQFIEKNY